MGKRKWRWSYDPTRYESIDVDAALTDEPVLHHDPDDPNYMRRRVPGANDLDLEAVEAKARFAPRACAALYPTLLSHKLLFVWPDGRGWEKASNATPPTLRPDFSDLRFSTVTIRRDLFYGYDTLMENVADPSHIDFAHHKVTGNSDRAKPLPFKVQKTGPCGFAGSSVNDTPTISSGFLCYFYCKFELPVKLPILPDMEDSNMHFQHPYGTWKDKVHCMSRLVGE